MNRQSKLHQIASRVEGGDTKAIAKGLRESAKFQDVFFSMFPGAARGFVDEPLAPGRDPIIVPSPSIFSVSHVNGVAYVQITLPQNRVPLTQQTAQGMTVNNPNAMLGTIVHTLQSFQNNSLTNPGTTHLYQGIATGHFAWPDTNTFWRIKSSFDNGKTFNEWSQLQQSNP